MQRVPKKILKRRLSWISHLPSSDFVAMSLNKQNLPDTVEVEGREDSNIFRSSGWLPFRSALAAPTTGDSFENSAFLRRMYAVVG